MNTKAKKTKATKTRVKKPKPNLHGPYSPTPMQKEIPSDREDTSDEKKYSGEE